MGGAWRGLRRSSVLSLAMASVLIAGAASVLLLLPARAAGSAQAEQPITIDGYYVGTYTVKTIVTPPETADLGILMTPGDVLAFALHLVTDSSGGGEAGITFYYEGDPLVTLPASLTWDGNHLEIDLHSEGAFEEDWHFDGNASSGDGIVILSGDWSACCYAYPTGVWEVTRPLSEEDGTTSTTSTIPSEGSLGGASTSTSAPTAVSSETPEGGEQSALSLSQSGDRRVFPEGGTSPAGVAVLILILILVLVASGMAVKDAIGAALVGVGLPPGPAPEASEVGPWVRELRRQVTRPRSTAEDTTVTVSRPVQPWMEPDASTPRTGLVLQPNMPYSVIDSTGTGLNDWVLVKSEPDGAIQGWVRRSELATLQAQVPTSTVWTPPRTAAWEWVNFPEDFRTETETATKHELYERRAGSYRLGPPDAKGNRQILDAAGHLLEGTIHQSQVPPPPNQPAAPPPPRPPPPP